METRQTRYTKTINNAHNVAIQQISEGAALAPIVLRLRSEYKAAWWKCSPKTAQETLESNEKVKGLRK
jgi:hypothetical protein